MNIQEKNSEEKKKKETYLICYLMKWTSYLSFEAYRLILYDSLEQEDAVAVDTVAVDTVAVVVVAVVDIVAVDTVARALVALAYTYVPF